MLNFQKILFAFVFVFITSKTFSQSTIENNPNVISQTHYYSFKGNEKCNKEIINELQNDLKKTEFVVDVNIKYSVEKKSGYIKVITQEKPVVKETDRSFSPAILKNIMLKHQLQPTHYSVEAGIK